jgi:hypothetical protein
MTSTVEIKELNALVSLVDEPNEDMFEVIRQKILNYGILAIPVLEDVWVNTMGDNDSKRIERIIEDIRQEVLITDFNLWASQTNNDIIDGLMIITKYFHPDFNEAHYTTLLQKLYRDTWLELNDNLTALEKIKVLNHIFYQVYGFNTDNNTVAKSDSYFLNRVFDFKTASIISLGILYIAIAQKLNIPIFGVDLPGHFVLAYRDENGGLSSPDKYDENSVLFYINVAKNGTVFTRGEITSYINQINIEPNSKYYSPSTNLAVLRRMMSELVDTLELENKQSKKLGIKKLLSKILHANNLPESASI